MSKTTITINGEECVILPAPKGAFLVKDGLQYPYFVEYAALSTSDKAEDISIYGLELSENEAYLDINCGEEELYSEVTAPMLQKFLDIEIRQGGDPRAHIIYLYHQFKQHGTPMEYGALVWFREKFKEHNITKKDFDVFA
ncbi:hypothetical protein [Ruminococcus sp.]|uniref:hypothetical protein n=1 Tax=Ruminococcus sp. TaxID=41978 RepID=UPI003F0FBD05